MNWTLEDARNDYRSTHPSCTKCNFYEYKLEISYDIYGIDRDINYCKVKEQEIKNISKSSEQCKYYTYK